MQRPLKRRREEAVRGSKRRLWGKQTGMIEGRYQGRKARKGKTMNGTREERKTYNEEYWGSWRKGELERSWGRGRERVTRQLPVAADRPIRILLFTKVFTLGPTISRPRSQICGTC